MLKDLDFTVFTDKTMRLVGHEHTVLKQWSLFKGSLVAPYLTLLSLPILFFFFFALAEVHQHFVQAFSQREKEVTCFGSDELQDQWSSCYNSRTSGKKIPRNVKKSQLLPKKHCAVM